MNNQNLLKQFFDDLAKSFTSSVYSYLIHYTPDYQYKSLKPYHKELEERLSSKTSIHYWGGKSNDYFMNFCSSSRSIRNHEYVKIYVPLNGDDVINIVTKIFNYIADNNIEHTSKLASETRTDDLVIRVTNVADAKKVIDFINNDSEICAGLYKSILPFDIKCGNVSVAYDERKSFHIDLANYIAEYVKSATKPLSLDGFKDYLEHLYSRKYCARYDKCDDYLTTCALNVKSDFDAVYMENFGYDFKKYQSNTLKILLLIMRNIEGKNSFDDFVLYYEMVNDSLYINDTENLLKNMYVKTKQGDFYKAEFGMFDKFLDTIQYVYNKDLSFYRGRVDGCVEISSPDIDTEPTHSYAEDSDGDTLDDTLDDTLECPVTRTKTLNSLTTSEVEFFMGNGIDDLETKDKLLQQQEMELNSLKEWLQIQIIENIDLINEYYLLKFDISQEFILDDDGNLLRRKKVFNHRERNEANEYEMYLKNVEISRNIITNNYRLNHGPDYYLGYLSKLLELETRNLAPSQMEAVTQHKEKCKKALYRLCFPNFSDDIERRQIELGITEDTDLEELAISLTEQYKTFQK